MVTVFFKEKIDDVQEIEFEADIAYLSDDFRFVFLAKYVEGEMTPRIVGRFYTANIFGYFIENDDED